MMRKFAITTFALLYAVLILSVSAARSNDWAVQEAATLAHHASGSHSPSFDKARTPETYQKKLLESEFVVELPREAIGLPIHFQRLILPSTFQYHSNWSGQPSSSRSPPLPSC